MKISIIIPIYNSNYIEKQLLSINNLYSSGIFFEVIFVDDGSDLNHKNEYKKYFSLFKDLNIIYEDLGEKNGQNRVSKARNRGAFLSQTENLIFIDEETILPYNYLLKLKEFISDENIVLGPYLGYNNLKKEINDEIINTFMKKSKIEDKNYEDFRTNFYKEKEQNGRIWEFFGASNFFIKKEIFLKSFGFDESITTWGDEDVEFGYRLKSMGHKIVFREDFKVLNLSPKLYNEPYSILEKEKIKELSENWFKNLKKHKTREYLEYVFDRFSHLPNDYKDLVSKDLIKLFSGKKIS